MQISDVCEHGVSKAELCRQCGIAATPVAQPEADPPRVKKVPVTSTWSCPSCNYQNVYREGVVSDPQNKCKACGQVVIVGAIRSTDQATTISPSTAALEAARAIVGTVFVNTGASYETLEATMIERITDYLSKHSGGGETEVERVVKESAIFAEKCFIEQSRLQAEVSLLNSEVEQARRNLIDAPLYNEDGSYTPVAQNVHDHARADAIGEAIDATKAERDRWAAKASEMKGGGWDSLVTAANTIIAALEQLKVEGGRDANLPD